MVTLPINNIDGNHTAKIVRLSILSTFGRLTMAFNQIVLPLFVLAIGFDEAFYGILVAAAGYVQGVILFPAGWFSDRRGRGVAILLGGLFAGACLLTIPFIADSTLLLIVYALTGIGTGFTRTSIDSLIADHTQKGDERTKSFGYTTTAATLAAIAGSFVAGLLLDPVAFPFISDEMTRYAILFWMMGFFRIATGIFGIYTERWLKVNDPVEKEQKEIIANEAEDPQKERQDTETALLFICAVSPYNSSFGKSLVIAYTAVTSSIAFCHTKRSLYDFISITSALSLVPYALITALPPYQAAW